jgi:hypothetical protein
LNPRPPGYEPGRPGTRRRRDARLRSGPTANLASAWSCSRIPARKCGEAASAFHSLAVSDRWTSSIASAVLPNARWLSSVAPSVPSSSDHAPASSRLALTKLDEVLPLLVAHRSPLLTSAPSCRTTLVDVPVRGSLGPWRQVVGRPSPMWRARPRRAITRLLAGGSQAPKVTAASCAGTPSC